MVKNEQNIQSIREKAKHALDSGNITQQEYDYYLRNTVAAQTSSHKIPPVMLALFVVFLGVVTWALLTGSPTGFSVYDPILDSYFESVNITLNTSSIERFALSGELTNGSLMASLFVNDTKYLVFEQTITPPIVWSEYASYAKGQDIDLQVAAENYTLWLVDKNESTIPINTTFSIAQPGLYTINALITQNETVVKESLQVVVRQDQSAQLNVLREQEVLIFTNECIETCALAISSATFVLEIQTTGNFTLTDVNVSAQEENSAPVQTMPLPTIVVTNSTTFDFSLYFSDVDNDSLVYDVNNIVGVQETIDGSSITFTSMVSGEYTTTLYVSDLQELLQVPLTIVVQEIVQEINETLGNASIVNETLNLSNTTSTNSSENISSNVSISTVQNTSVTNVSSRTNPSEIILGEVLDCTHPNINKRPPECFGDAFDAVFAEVTSIIKNKEQEKVARVTRLGNLVIQGIVIENSSQSPSSQDFVLGFTQRNNFVDVFVPTAWIDSTTGDLHLQGRVYQEQLSITPTKYDSYFIMNKNDIVLLYINSLTGDAFVKGNIVQGGNP